jgi:hypothetical protein
MRRLQTSVPVHFLKRAIADGSRAAGDLRKLFATGRCGNARRLVRLRPAGLTQCCGYLSQALQCAKLGTPGLGLEGLVINSAYVHCKGLGHRISLAAGLINPVVVRPRNPKCQRYDSCVRCR